MVTNFGAFLAVAAVVIVTPGPDTALTIRNALVGGRRGGILTAAGVVTGLATWALAASTGVAALLQASAPAFLALKLAVFFVSLLPQFTPRGHASFVALLALGLVFCAMTFVWLTGYAVLVARAKAFFRRGIVGRLLDGLTGVVLIALGARIATERT